MQPSGKFMNSILICHTSIGDSDFIRHYASCIPKPQGRLKVCDWERMRLGYLPRELPQRSPILSPVEVRLPQLIDDGQLWTDFCGGSCGFAMGISDTRKLITWGSTDDLGQSYATSGKHGETPEPFPLPKEVSIVRATAGWAHCVCVTTAGEVYTWGWKEFVPSGKVVGDPNTAQSQDKDIFERQNPFLTEQASPKSRSSGVYGKVVGDETTKIRRVSSSKQAVESSSSGNEPLSALPCLVALNPGVRISTAVAGGRHTLALSDVGQVWGWGYGGEGQLGLGSRIWMVSSPHPIPCIATSAVGKDRRGSVGTEGQGYRVPGSYIKGIAYGGRHSAVVTDVGALMTFCWGLYGHTGLAIVLWPLAVTGAVKTLFITHTSPMCVYMCTRKEKLLVLLLMNQKKGKRKKERKHGCCGDWN